MEPLDFSYVLAENEALINNMVSKMSRKTPAFVTRHDLYQAALIGLFDAARNYKNTKIPFGAYAFHRIRGSMLDFLREQRSRSQRRSGIVHVDYEETDVSEQEEYRQMSEQEEAVAEMELTKLTRDVMCRMRETNSLRDIDIFASSVFHGLSHVEIAATHKLTESRIAQIVKKLNGRFVQCAVSMLNKVS